MTALQHRDGALSPCRASTGQSIDASGKGQSVCGDMTTLRCVPGLGRAAKRLLLNIAHTSRKLLGTQGGGCGSTPLRTERGPACRVSSASPITKHMVCGSVRMSRVHRRDHLAKEAGATGTRYCGIGAQAAAPGFQRATYGLCSSQVLGELQPIRREHKKKPQLK